MTLLKIAEKEIHVQPTLQFIETLETEFGPLMQIVQKMQNGDFQTFDHVRLSRTVWAEHQNPLTETDIEAFLKKEGVLGLAQINLKILAISLTGLNALESFFQEVPDRLGKSSAGGIIT